MIVSASFIVGLRVLLNSGVAICAVKSEISRVWMEDQDSVFC